MSGHSFDFRQPLLLHLHLVVAVLAVPGLVVVVGSPRAREAQADAAGSALALKLRHATFDANVNDLIDENLDIIQGLLSPMDPMPLKDLRFSLIKGVFMNLHTGWMQNLSQLKRSGNCIIQYSNKIFSVNLNLEWRDLTFDYEYSLKILLGSRKGDLHGQLSNLKVNIVLEYNFEVNLLALQRFEFVESGKINIALEGHKIDKLYNVIIKTVTRVSHKSILEAIQNKVTEIIRDKINELNNDIGKDYRRITFVNLAAPVAKGDDIAN